MGDFKSYTASTILRMLEKDNSEFWLSQLRFHKAAYKKDREYQFWQEGSHPQQIYREEMMRQKIGYIHDNPVRKGYVDEPTHWCYSSARNYAGMKGLLEVKTEWM